MFSFTPILTISCDSCVDACVMQIRVISMPEIDSIQPLTALWMIWTWLCELEIFKTNCYYLYNELHAHTHTRFKCATKRLSWFCMVISNLSYVEIAWLRCRGQWKTFKLPRFCHRSYFLLIIIFTLRTMRQKSIPFNSIRLISFSFRWLAATTLDTAFFSRFSISFFGAKQPLIVNTVWYIFLRFVLFFHRSPQQRQQEQQLHAIP